MAIHMDGDDSIYYLQSPWVIENRDEVGTFINGYDFSIPHQLDDYKFRVANVFQNIGDEHVDEETNFDGFEQYEGYQLKRGYTSDRSDYDLVIYYGTEERPISLWINNGIRETEITDEVLDVKIEVEYNDTELIENQEEILIDGYEGTLLLNELENTFHIMYNDLFITLRDSTKEISIDMFSDIVKGLEN